MSIVEQRKDELREEFGFFESPEERFEYIISKTKNKEGLAEEFKSEKYLVRGCVSNLWLVPSFEEGKCAFKTDADSIITKGIASLVSEMYSGLSPQEILDFDCAFLSEIGIEQYLSPNRRNGLSKLCEKITDFAKSKI
ncbi:SufE family protein [Intestinicryptomonas porci]|uniref:SufE family protein n=1 Tax=Intestinicryptomonas porci TaxID=2926320 RepID=A0ABU4WGH4_9BACT|nr:SufE family protein [Opitutales bacterium CLA-KB-P66]